MALSVNGGGGGLGSRRQRGGAALSEINVTPFVDVVLVLLIIFMITAHVMEFGLEVDVPKVRPVSKEVTEEMPVVSIPKDGLLYLNGKPVNIHELRPAIEQKFGKTTKGVYVMADRQTTWELMAQVVAALGEAKFQVNLVTQPEDSVKSRK
jgi:biopolymer transport protein ExbD